MIEVAHLTKDYGTVVAVRDVSFNVGRGEVVGFLGPNGAGKSTTLRILAGYLGATRGRIRIDGIDVQEDSINARRAIGYMPEAAPLYPEMRVAEYLGFRAALKRVPRKRRRDAVSFAMKQAAVADMTDTLIEHLSKGYRQRVALADALVANPPLLILDEPTAGLDPNQIREVRRLIRELGENHTILLSTHILSEVESTCDRALVIDRGRLVAEGTIEELRARQRPSALSLTLNDPEGRAKKLLEALPGVRQVKRSEGASGAKLMLKFDAESEIGDLTERVVSALVSAGIGVREATPSKASLEEVFAKLTRQAESELEEGSA